MVHNQREFSTLLERMGWDRANNVDRGGMWQRQKREGAVAVEASIYDRNIVIAPIGNKKKMWQEEGIECLEGEMKREGEEEEIICPKSHHQHDVIVHIHGSVIDAIVEGRAMWCGEEGK